MAGMSDWTRARQVEEGASATRTVSDAGSADPLGASQQTLVVCSVLQVCAFGTFVHFFSQEPSPSPLIYAAGCVCLGVIGLILACMGASGRGGGSIWLIHALTNCLVLGLLVDPAYYDVIECRLSADCEGNCPCKVLNLVAFNFGLALQAVGAWRVWRIACANSTHELASPDAYHRFETGLVTQSVLHTPAGSEAAVEEGHEGGGGSGSEEMRKRLQQEARFAANRVFR